MPAGSWKLDMATKWVEGLMRSRIGYGLWNDEELGRVVMGELIIPRRYSPGGGVWHRVSRLGWVGVDAG
jgi:hypothetical protein